MASPRWMAAVENGAASPYSAFYPKFVGGCVAQAPAQGSAGPSPRPSLCSSWHPSVADWRYGTSPRQTIVSSSRAPLLSAGGGINAGPSDAAPLHGPSAEEWAARSWWGRHRPLVMLLPIVMSYITLLALLAPRLVKVLKDYFGSDGEAAMWQSYYDSAGSLVAFFFAGFVGSVTDAVGRRPIILLYSVCLVVPPLLLALNMDIHVYLLSLQFNTVMAGGKGGSLVFAPYIADSYPPLERTKVFAILIGFMCIGLTVGPVAAALPFSNHQVFLAAACFLGAVSLYAIVCIPESLPKDARKPFSFALVRNPFAPLRHLCQSRLVASLAAVSFMTSLPEMGMADIFLFYLDGQLGFSKEQQSWFLFEMGFTIVIGQGPLMYLLLRWLGTDSRVLLVGLLGQAVFLGVFMAVRQAWQVFAFVAPMMSVGLLCFPCLTGIASRHFAADEQGAGLAVIQAVKGLAMCIGPMMFSQLYGRCKGPPVNFPQMPFAGGLLFTALGFAFTCCGMIPALRGIDDLPEDGRYEGDDEDDDVPPPPASPDPPASAPSPPVSP